MEGESWVQDPMGVCNLPIKRKKLYDFLSFNSCVRQNLSFNEQTELTICIPDNIFQQTHDNYHITPSHPTSEKTRRKWQEQRMTRQELLTPVLIMGNQSTQIIKKILAFL